MESSHEGGSQESTDTGTGRAEVGRRRSCGLTRAHSSARPLLVRVLGQLRSPCLSSPLHLSLFVSVIVHADLG